MNENIEIETGYWAVITADVLFDPTLSPIAKILYAHITVLQKKQGYCYASNAYFAQKKVLNCAKETVSRRISELEKRGYIKTQIVYKADGKTVDKRLIYVITIPFHHTINTPIDTDVNTPIDKNVNSPHDEQINTPIDTDVKDNNTRVNNTSSNISLSNTDVGAQEKRVKPTTLKELKEILINKYNNSGVEFKIPNYASLIIRNGYLHSKVSGRDLSPGDAKEVWGVIAEHYLQKGAA